MRRARQARIAPKPWTVLLFMVGDSELRPSIARDILELERAGSSDEVNVVAAVQLTSRSDCEWLEIQPKDEEGRPTKAVRVGRSTAADLDGRLSEFLENAGKKYPADHYLLMMWGHASGLGFGRFAPGAKEDLIRLGQLAGSLNSLRAARPGRPKLEILGFCACAVSKAEYAIELRDAVDFLVSSQIGISTLMTWPFDSIVRRVLMSPTVQPGTLACQIVQAFERSYEPPPVALTALALRSSDGLSRQVDKIAKSILKALNARGIQGRLNNLCVLEAFRKALAAYPFDVEPLVDFFDFCARLVDEEGLQTSVRRQARGVLDRGARSFVVQNARSGPKFGALNGLAILAPVFEDPDFGAILDRCSDKSASSARLWRKTSWAEMVRKVQEFAAANQELYS